MSTAHDDLAAFQQFALQKVNAGEADTLEELFDPWLTNNPTPEEQAEVHARVSGPRLVHPEQIADLQMEVRELSDAGV